jgi:RNA-directed DNA polymerase
LTISTNEDTILNRYGGFTFRRATALKGPSRYPPCTIAPGKPSTRLSLDPVAETTAEPNSYGVRTARGAADAIEACFIALCRNDRAKWILEGDIRSCFDKISHAWLLAHIPLEQAMLKKWLQAGYLENHHFHPTEEGTPQGGIISPAVANMTLDGLERLLASHCSKTSRVGRRAKVKLIRYADAFCVTGSSKELLEQQVKPLIEHFLKERGLE